MPVDRLGNERVLAGRHEPGRVQHLFTTLAIDPQRPARALRPQLDPAVGPGLRAMEVPRTSSAAACRARSPRSEVEARAEDGVVAIGGDALRARRPRRGNRCRWPGPRAPGRPFEQAAAGPARQSRPDLAGRDGIGSAERIAVGGNQRAQLHLLLEGAPDERRGGGQRQELAGLRGQEQARVVQNEEFHPGVGRTTLLGSARSATTRSSVDRRADHRSAATSGSLASRTAQDGGPRRPPARGRPCRAAAETLAARSRPELGRRIARGNARARGGATARCQ